ncbi:MAG TPA: hypothetical protein VEQ60_15880 [Longimicrobium sp.]|nr:hypothetical protein [Longimicrobium sp.]
MRDHSSSTAVLPKPVNRIHTFADENLPDVPPLGYTQLRLLCEWAAGIANERAHFVFTGKTLTRATSNDVDAAQVLVPTLLPGKFPDIAEVGLQVPPATEDLTGVPMLNAVDYRADAVFWSDSAVQKFIFPYVASCGGHQAGVMLSRLQQAWNFYRPDLVTVYGLMHVTHPDLDTALELDKAFCVVFALPGDANTLYALSLSDFLDPEQPWNAPGGDLPELLGHRADDVPYTRGAMDTLPDPVYPEYMDLRAMTEYAASLGTESRYFIFRTSGAGLDDMAYAELPPLEPGDVVIPASTPTMPAGRPQVKTVWFQPPGEEPENVGDGDAVFWSTGAIEQFLFPYYASKLGFAAPEDLATMRTAWDPDYIPPVDITDGLVYIEAGDVEPAGNTVAAPAKADAATPDGEANLDEEDPVVYGLVHLPKSAWVTEDEVSLNKMLRSGLPEKHVAKLQKEDDHRAHGKPSPWFLPRHEVGVLHRASYGHRMLTLHDFMILHRKRFH